MGEVQAAIPISSHGEAQQQCIRNRIEPEFWPGSNRYSLSLYVINQYLLQILPPGLFQACVVPFAFYLSPPTFHLYLNFVTTRLPTTRHLQFYCDSVTIPSLRTGADLEQHKDPASRTILSSQLPSLPSWTPFFSLHISTHLACTLRPHALASPWRHMAKYPTCLTSVISICMMWLATSSLSPLLSRTSSTFRA